MQSLPEIIPKIVEVESDDDLSLDFQPMSIALTTNPLVPSFDPVEEPGKFLKIL
jgi:hypothetical protein